MTATDVQEGTVVRTGAPMLQLRGVNKSFGAVHVQRAVDFDV